MPGFRVDARFAVLFILGCLILVLSVDNLLQTPFNPVRWLVQILPLLAFYPALLGKSLRPYQWLCFLSLFYFTLAVLTTFTPGRTLSGSLQTLCCVLLFSSAIFYIRNQGKSRQAEQLSQSDS